MILTLWGVVTVWRAFLEVQLCFIPSSDTWKALFAPLDLGLTQ